MEIDHLNSDDFFNRLRKREYARLDRAGHVYLDYTGGNIHPQCLADEHYHFLQQTVYGNPHSENPASQLSGKFISEAREAVLTFFNAQDYYCVFTGNASAALQIVGECYPFSNKSHLLLTTDNHNSVNGIREYCKNKEGSFSYCSMNTEELSINGECLTAQLQEHVNKKHKLFAFPAQSNASGVRHSLDWIKKAQEQGWDVLLDAAAFAPSSKLDLTEVKPEFVCLSFYKMFGYPTGLGCLLMKKSVFHKLEKPWFAGGTVSLVSVNYRKHFLVDGLERFENGTVNYLDIPAITNGLNFVRRVGIERINDRIKLLTGLLIEDISKLRHRNGMPLTKIYGSKNIQNRGGTIMMNFFDVDGKQYPHHVIETAANEKMISLRTGCFCNPGIDEINSKIAAEKLQHYFASRKNADYHDMIDFLGKLRGAIRISVGIPTTRADIARFVSFAEVFINQRISSANKTLKATV
jgi:selenocysteine lyase/cysteine desulfurase